MTKKVLILLVLYMCTYTPALWAKKEKVETNPYYASTQKTKIAVYILNESTSYMGSNLEKSLAGYITEGLIESKQYIAVNRYNALNTLIQQALANQRNGHIDYTQIVNATKQYGETQICAVHVTHSGSYDHEFRASIIDVSSNVIIKTASARVDDRLNYSEMEVVSKKIIAGLLRNNSQAAQQVSQEPQGKSYVAWTIASGGFPWNATSGISSRFGGVVGIGFYGDVGVDLTRITVEKTSTTTKYDYNLDRYVTAGEKTGYWYVTRTTFHYAGGIKFFPYNGLYLACGYGSIVKPFANVKYDKYGGNNDKDGKVAVRKMIPAPTHGLLLHIGYDVVPTYSYEEYDCAFFLSISGGVSYDMITKEYMPFANLKIGVAWSTR